MIEELVWWEPNIEKLAAHGIGFWEVDEMVTQNTSIFSSHDDHPDRVRVIAPQELPR